MTCPNCAAGDRDGTFDKRKLCCAIRLIEKSTREQADMLVAQVSERHGHDPDALRAGVAELRRERRKRRDGEAAR